MVVWDLASLTILHTFSGHAGPIFEMEAVGDRIVSRDKSGSLVLWDAVLATDPDYEDTEDSLVLMRRLDLDRKEDIACINTGLRSLTVGRRDCVVSLDFWDSTIFGTNDHIVGQKMTQILPIKFQEHLQVRPAMW